MKVDVFRRHVEKENFTVLHKNNVSLDEHHVIRLFVIMMVSVVEMRVVSVPIVSMDDQMIKINVP